MRKTANSSAVSCIVKNVTEMTCQHLGSKFIKLRENEVKHPTYCFGKVHGFPQCLGAVDGTHVNIKKPKNNSTDFINRKGHHSINVQACVNYNYCFFDVVVKWPASVHDAPVWGNSSINQMLRDGTIPECFKVIVDSEDPVPVCILGDPAYPLLGYLMKEFSSGGTTPEEEFFS